MHLNILLICLLSTIVLVYSAPIVNLVAGSGMLAQETPFGNPTLSIAAVQRDSVLGCFEIFYPPDVTYNTSTTILGSVSCLEGSSGTAYVTGLVASSNGPRSATFPVGNYLAIAIQSNTLAFTGATYNVVCAPHTSGLAPLNAGHYVVYP